MTTILLVAALLSLVAASGSLVLLGAMRRQDRISARLATLHHPDGAEPEDRPGRHGLLGAVTAVGSVLARSGLLSSNTLAQLEQTLVSAGFRGANGLGLFVGFKLLLLLLLPVAAWVGLRGLDLTPLVRGATVAAAAIAGMLLPDYYVRSRRAAVLRRLEAGLPDALDLMVICSEAGLSLEPTLARVAVEIKHAHPAVADELGITARDLAVTSDRRDALLKMGSRTGLETLKRLGTTLVQTLQYGTPLSQALRTLSVEMRGEMLVRFEGRAARLPVLLTLPMIIFILPTVFMVVGGPAMLSVMAAR